MTKLNFKDFQLAITDDRKFYHSFSFRDYEICLEPCLNGFDVAIYKVGPDEGIGGLVEEKICTDFNFKRKEWTEGKLAFGLDGLKKGERNMLLLRAMKFANQFYIKHNK